MKIFLMRLFFQKKLIFSDPNISPKNEDIDYNSLKLIDFKINHVNK